MHRVGPLKSKKKSPVGVKKNLKYPHTFVVTNATDLKTAFLKSPCN